MGVLVLGEHRRHHHGVGAVVEADLGQAAEELVPVDIAVADLEVLVHPRRIARRVGDVPQPVAAVVVHGVGDVHQPQLVARGSHDLGHVAAHVKRVAGDVHHADVGGVDAADDPQRLQPVLDEIVGVRVDPDVDAFTFEDRHQLLHRPEERPLGFLGRSRAAGELGVDHVDAEVDGDLDDAFPVAHRGLSRILVGARPPQHRQHRGDADTRVGAGLAELGDQFVVGAGVVEERDEVAVRRQLQVLVAEFGDHAREFEQLVVVVERGGVQCDLHVTLPVIDARSTIFTSTGSPLLSDSTPASHTAAAA